MRRTVRKKKWKVNRNILKVLPILLVLVIVPFLRVAFWCIVMILIGAASLLYQQYFKYIGFELVTFVTIIMSVAFNPAIGIIVGCSAYILGQAAVGQITHYSLVTLAGICLAAILTSTINISSIVALGIVINITINIIMGIGWTLFGFNALETLYTSSLNVLFNYIFLNTLARFLVNLVKL
ncbi:MAG: hypothetical protein KKF44_03160 [Nanoarchaeota archaeon]|nr:hypothetical protein [Nanoarchaeota archaeon]